MRRVILLWSAVTVLTLGVFLPLRAQEIALTSDGYNHEFPQWSPNRSWVVYMKKAASGDRWQIYKVSSSGGTEICLTSDGYDHWYPQWSPDGNWIAYTKWDSTGCRQIYKVSSSGGAEICLTSDGYDHEYPQWSPDGNWIVYEKGDVTGYAQIYKVPSEVGIEEKKDRRHETRDIRLSAHPNPFTKKTVIRYSSLVINDQLPISQFPVSLCIYDVSGRLVRNLVTGDLCSGALIWDGKDNSNRQLSGGVYFVKFRTEDYKETRKILMVR